jgi:LysM repeat protein
VIALARRFGIDWMELVDLNSLAYPFTIHPGQVLQLPVGAGRDSVAEPEPTPTPKPVLEVKWRVNLPIVGKNAPLETSGEVNSVDQTPIKTVMVLYADTLINFANSINADWMMLVNLNKLSYPYMVYPGQVLRIR